MNQSDINHERDRQRILTEIRRTALANGRVPLGIGKFLQETGIRASDWQGKIWVRWSDAVREAGFEPNQLQGAYRDDFLIDKLIELSRELGHFPLSMEISIKRRGDNSFPTRETFRRCLGSKQQRAEKVLHYCKDRIGYDDVIAWRAPLAALHAKPQESGDSLDALATNATGSTKEGYVYMALLKLGREKRYKIGKAVLVGRRTDQISVQLPEDLELVHAIRTDDAYGIVDY